MTNVQIIQINADYWRLMVGEAVLGYITREVSFFRQKEMFHARTSFQSVDGKMYGVNKPTLDEAKQFLFKIVRSMHDLIHEDITVTLPTYAASTRAKMVVPPELEDWQPEQEDVD